MATVQRVLLVGITLLFVAGCSAPAPVPTAAPTPPQTPAPTESPEVTDGILATGTFVSELTETTGTVQISRSGDTVHFELPDFSVVTERESELLFSRDTVPASQTCFDTGERFSLGATSAVHDLPMTVFDADEMWEFRTAVITLVPLSASEPCLGEVVAVAPLTWTIP